MEWLILPTTILAIAFLVHGFPDIHIGTKKFYEKDNNQNK